MARKRKDGLEGLVFPDDLPEEEYREGYDLFGEEEPSEEEGEDDLLPELEIGENGHIRPRRSKRGHGEEEDSPIVLNWDE